MIVPMYAMTKIDERSELRDKVLDVIEPHVLPFIIDAWVKNPSREAISCEQLEKKTLTIVMPGESLEQEQHKTDENRSRLMLLTVNGESMCVFKDIGMKLQEVLLEIDADYSR